MVRKTTIEKELKIERRVKKNERRTIRDRRTSNDDAIEFDGDDRRQKSRRKGERRRQIDPTTCERDYCGEEIQFMQAMDLYKRKSGRQFPTWSEVLEVLKSMGYRLVAEPTEIEMQYR